MHVGMMEVLVVLALTGGGSSNDLAAWLNGGDYFKSRQIEVKVEKMVELAGRPPADAKASIAQLLATRWLGEHPAEVKKDKNARETLVQLALGKKGPDPQGFAGDYARRALALVDGKPVALVEMPKNSLSEDAARWFPEKCIFFGGIDVRASGPSRLADDARLRARLLKLLPDREKEQVYQFVETVGNIRIDRFAGAFLPDPNEKDKNRIFLRFTGRADPERLANFLAQTISGRGQQPVPPIKKEKGPKGEPMLLIGGEDHPPAIAVVGDTDLIMAGLQGNQGDHAAVLQQVLDARAGKQPNLTTGPLGAALKRVPAQAFALVTGDPPADMRLALTRGGLPFSVLPQMFTLDATRSKGTTVRFEGTLAKAEDARALAENAQQLKQKVLDVLKEVPAEAKIKKESIEQFRKALEGIQIKADGTTVKGSAEIAWPVFEALQEVIENRIMQQSGAARNLKPPPPPEPKKD